MGVFGAFVAGLAGATAVARGKLPEKGPSVGEMALLAVATHEAGEADHQRPG